MTFALLAVTAAQSRPVPDWLHHLSVAWVILGFVCGIIVLIDVIAHPQRMWIMSVVWPVTALFGTFLTLIAYYKYGRLGTKKAAMEAKKRNEDPPNMRFTPFPMMVGKGAAHCGAGCTLGDIVAEWTVVFFPIVATWFGYKTIFDEKIFAIWIPDYIVAWGFGVAFQYFTIKPMRGLSVGKGLLQAVKADTASITSWQLGMYGWMAIAHFAIFGAALGPQTRSQLLGVLVHDADRHALRLPNRLPGQLVADQKGR